MLQLSESQWNLLHQFYGLVKTAEFELTESLFSGNMSKGASALSAVQQAMSDISGPENLIGHLRTLTRFPHLGQIEQKVAMRQACEACHNLSEIENLLEELFIKSGRNESVTLH